MFSFEKENMQDLLFKLKNLTTHCAFSDDEIYVDIKWESFGRIPQGIKQLKYSE